MQNTILPSISQLNPTTEPGTTCCSLLFYARLVFFPFLFCFDELESRILFDLIAGTEK